MSVNELLEEIIEDAERWLRRHRHHHKPESIGLIFPCFNPGGYSVNTVSIPVGLFVKATPAYLNADGTPSLDSDGKPIPIFGPLAFTASGPDVAVVVNPNNTLSLGVSAGATVGGTWTVTVTDASTPPLTGTINGTNGAAVAEGVPASIDFTFDKPQTTAPTS